mgnify:CR=1 FL=1
MQVPFLSLHDVTAMHGDEIRKVGRIEERTIKQSFILPCCVRLIWDVANEK